MLAISSNGIYRCNSLIKVATIIHDFLLVWILTYLILNILNCWMARALRRLQVRVSPWRGCLLILRVLVNLICRHCIAIHHRTWVRIVLYYLLAGLHDFAVVVGNILVFSAFLWIFLNFYYLSNSYLIYIISIYYDIISIFWACFLTTWLYEPALFCANRFWVIFWIVFWLWLICFDML